MDIMLPYNLALDIDKYFESTDQGSLTHKEFIDVVETLQVTGSIKNQKHTADLFKRLPKEEVIKRSETVVRLDKLLRAMKSNGRHDLSST